MYLACCLDNDLLERAEILQIQEYSTLEDLKSDVGDEVRSDGSITEASKIQDNISRVEGTENLLKVYYTLD